MISFRLSKVPVLFVGIFFSQNYYGCFQYLYIISYNNPKQFLYNLIKNMFTFFPTQFETELISTYILLLYWDVSYIIKSLWLHKISHPTIKILLFTANVNLLAYKYNQLLPLWLFKSEFVVRVWCVEIFPVHSFHTVDALFWRRFHESVNQFTNFVIYTIIIIM